MEKLDSQRCIYSTLKSYVDTTVSALSICKLKYNDKSILYEEIQKQPDSSNKKVVVKSPPPNASLTGNWQGLSGMKNLMILMFLMAIFYNNLNRSC